MGWAARTRTCPRFVVMVARPSNTEQVQAISARLWSSGYLPGEHAGVSFRTAGDPILYINNPRVSVRACAVKTLDGLRPAQRIELSDAGRSRNAHAHRPVRTGFRMQSSVPDLTSVSDEPEHTYALYGEAAKQPGTFCQHSLAGPAHGRTRRALRSDLSQQLGHACQRRRSIARPMPRCGSGLLWPYQGLETAWLARFHADHLGRRVRTNHLLAGWSDQRNYGRDHLRAATRCGWPVVAQGWRRLW